MTTANFNKLDKSMLNAMRDSNYFKREGVENVYKGNPTIGIETGSPEFNKEANKDPKKFFGDSKGFLDNFKAGALSNLDKSKDKSDTDKYLDFLRESRGMMGGNAQFGNFGGGMATEVAQGLTAYNPPSPNQQMFIPGQEATGKSLGQRLAGAAVGLGKGLLTGVPHGGAFGAVSGFFA